MIPPEVIWAAVEREVRVLATMGRTGDQARKDAIEITRAKVRNSEPLAEQQTDASRCHVCAERNDDTSPVIAVLTGKPHRVIFLHAGCHEQHRRAVTAKVEAVMGAAGYGVGEG